jgi:hypothetical protein
MQVQCIFEAWDSKNARHYLPGVVPDFDENNEDLTSLLVPGGAKYVFQYPGHEVPSPKVKQATPITQNTAVAEPVEPAKKKGKPMSAEHKKKLIEARARKKAEREARLQEDAA